MRLRWRDFELPMGLECDTDTLTDSYGFFWIEPFERGLGVTMGNSLRRILLSSIQGSAVTSVMIPNIRCEFENIDGVVEDTTELVMNIKKLYIKMHSDEPLILKIQKEGPCEIRGADILPHQDVEIMNPDHLLCTVTGNHTFTAELEVRKGRGFVLARENMEKCKSVNANAFSIDSIYSPIQRIAHKIVGTRVGQRTDYEKLEMEIWTNGVVSPKEAMNEAASIMRKHTTPFLSLNNVNRAAKSREEAPVEKEEENTDLEEKFKLPISVLEPSARTRNCLEAEGIQTLGQFVCFTEHELLKFGNFGQTSLNEIKESLGKFGLTIGMRKRE